MSCVEISNGDLVLAMMRSLVSMRLRATFEGKVVCVLVKVRSCATFEGKVVCVLGIQVDYEGSSYVECACRVGVELIGLDTTSSAELKT